MHLLIHIPSASRRPPSFESRSGDGKALTTTLSVLRDEVLSHLWELTFVQVHTHGIHLLDRPVEMSLEIPMGTQCFRNVTCATVLGVKLNRLEVLHVVPVEKHVANSRSFLVNLEWVTCEDNAFGNDPGWIRRKEGAHANKIRKTCER